MPYKWIVGEKRLINDQLTNIWAACKSAVLQVWSISGDRAVKTGQKIRLVFKWCDLWVSWIHADSSVAPDESLRPSPSWKSRCWKENRYMFLYHPAPTFFSLLLILYSCGEGTSGWLKRRASSDDTLLTLLALILMPHARGWYTIHFNAISSCQEGWVIQWEHNCILKFLHWFIPGM